jgi:hypothetical protein
MLDPFLLETKLQILFWNFQTNFVARFKVSHYAKYTLMLMFYVPELNEWSGGQAEMSELIKDWVERLVRESYSLCLSIS